MPNVFTISNANPIHFSMLVDNNNTINFGNIFPDNDLYPVGLSDPAQNICGRVFPPFQQVYCCTDSTNIQIRYDRSGYVPVLHVFDSQGGFITELSYVNSNDGYFTFLLEFGDYRCNDCIYFSVMSRMTPLIGGFNIYAAGDSGTMETGISNVLTGAANTISQSNAHAQAGTYSALVTATATPDTLILYDNALWPFYSAGLYYASAWIYVPKVGGFTTTDGDEIEITVASGNVLSQTKWVRANLVTNSWQQIGVLFYGSPTSAGIKIQINTGTHIAGAGTIYIDTIKLNSVDYIEEARSENISIQNDCDCTIGMEYYCDSTKFGIHVNGNPTFFIRLNGGYISRRVVAETEKYLNSVGTISRTKTVSKKKYKWFVKQIPDFLSERVALACFFDHLFVDGIEYVQEDNIELQELDGSMLRPFELELSLREYPYSAGGSC